MPSLNDASFYAQLQSVDLASMPSALSPFQNFGTIFTSGSNAQQSVAPQVTAAPASGNSQTGNSSSGSNKIPKKFTFDLKEREAKRMKTDSVEAQVEPEPHPECEKVSSTVA
jgi:hypothetical protein